MTQKFTKYQNIRSCAQTSLRSVCTHDLGQDSPIQAYGISRTGLVKRGLVKRGLAKRGLVKRRLVKRRLVKRGLVKRGLVKRRLVKRGLVNRGLVKRGLVKRGLVKRGLLRRGLVKRGLVKRGLVKRGLDWLIGYYFHYVNSSPLSWKQYCFVSEETKQKRFCISSFYDLLLQYDLFYCSVLNSNSRRHVQSLTAYFILDVLVSLIKNNLNIEVFRMRYDNYGWKRKLLNFMLKCNCCFLRMY